METFLNITIPLILTGLGFITYKHPDISRKLLNILFYIAVIAFIISSIFYLGRLNQYHEIYTSYIQDESNIDKIFKIQDDFNSGTLKSIYVYFGLTLAVIAIFHFLSVLFDKAMNPNSEKHNNGSNETPL